MLINLGLIILCIVLLIYCLYKCGIYWLKKMDKIIPGLFLGNIRNAGDLQ